MREAQGREELTGRWRVQSKWYETETYHRRAAARV